MMSLRSFFTSQLKDTSVREAAQRGSRSWVDFGVVLRTTIMLIGVALLVGVHLSNARAANTLSGSTDMGIRDTGVTNSLQSPLPAGWPGVGPLVMLSS